MHAGLRLKANGVDTLMLEIIYACFKIGAVSVSMNPAFSSRQVALALRHVEATVYVTSTALTLPYKQPRSTQATLQYLEQDCTLDSERMILVNNDAKANVLPESCGGQRHSDYERLMVLHRGSTFRNNGFFNSDDTANLQFTSGTTSSPKAVCLSHRSILNNALISATLFGMSEYDIMPCTMPLYHCGGLVLMVLMAMSSGASLIIPSQSFDARATMDALSKERCTMFAGVPTMLKACLRLMEEPEYHGHDFSHIRTGFVGGSPIPTDLRRQLNRLHLEDIRNIYGMTELSPIITMAGPWDIDERRYSTVGRTYPQCQVRIVARDDPQRTLKVGERGEVVGAGMVMRGYWRDARLTSEVFLVTKGVNGTDTTWMRTGDEGMMDRDGYLTITGRIKDIIIRGGENIYPADVEDILLQRSQVRSVSVVGLADPLYGESVAAFVVPERSACVQASDMDANTFDLRDKVEPSQLAHGHSKVSIKGEDIRNAVLVSLSKHQSPKYVFWVDNLPMTPSGKIEKFRLVSLGTYALSQISQRPKDRP